MTARIAQRQIVGPPTRTAEKVQVCDAQRFVDQISAALIAMADASLSGDDVVSAVAAMRFSAFVGGGTASVLERAGDDWKYLDSQAAVAAPIARMLNVIAIPAEVVNLVGVGVFIPINSGSIGVLLRNSVISESHRSGLRILAIGFELALAAARQRRETLDALNGISGLERIARRILSVGDLDEILFSISQETQRLLSADICGVFLQENDYMVMRGCVGNHTRDIAKIRLRRGQGLAGRVFETGLHWKENDYLKSKVLSQEYAELVRAERIRSALGAPLRGNNELVGVLEVWRRGETRFNEADVRRVLALSSLTTIAINNAQLYEKQKSLVEQVTIANENLRRQNDISRRSAEITDAVIQVLLDGEGLTAIGRVVAGYTNAEVAFLTCDLQMMAGFPSPLWLEECLPLIKRAVVENHPAQNKATMTLRLGERWLSLRSVIAGRDHAGWICALSNEQPGHLQEIAITQAAKATALNYLEQRAASRARAEILGGILWELLEGTAYARQTAASRAKELQIDLRGPLRIIHFTAEGLDETDGSEKLGTGVTERRLKLVQEIFKRGLRKSGVLRLMATRGSLLVAAVTAENGTQIKQILKSVEESMIRELSGLRTFWGVSAPCANARNLHAAHCEA
ncbi:MAG: GAF domain-containing protein, partial [Roseiarcus sp.]